MSSSFKIQNKPPRRARLLNDSKSKNKMEGMEMDGKKIKLDSFEFSLKEREEKLRGILSEAATDDSDIRSSWSKYLEL